MSQTRQSWEPAREKDFFAALAANKVVFTGQYIVHGIIATNNGAAATTMTISEMQGGAWTQVGTLAVPIGATVAFPIPSSGVLFNGLAVTPAAALDVTVLRT